MHEDSYLQDGVLHLSDDLLGQGIEHDCYRILDSGGGFTRLVAKVPRKRWRWLQKKTVELVEKEIRILKVEFGDIDGLVVDKSFRILRDIEVLRKGTQRRVEYVTTSLYLEDFDERVVSYADLVGVEAERYTKNLFELVKIEKGIFENYGCVFDIMGLGEIIATFMKGLPQAAVLGISRLMPKMLKDLMRYNINGLNGRASNFVKVEEGIQCIDPGMYHFADRRIVDRLAKSFYVFTLTALVELLKHLNGKLDPALRIAEEELLSLEYQGSRFQKSIARRIMNGMMIPLFERHERIRREREERLAVLRCSNPTNSN